MLHLLLIAALQPMALQGHPNLVANGDFSLGNTKFVSQYTFGKDLGMTGTYYIGSNPHDSHEGGASFGDHTSGHGLMLVANGIDKPNAAIWKQTVKVQPNHRYYFVAWAASWGIWGPGDGDSNPARLVFSVNGSSISSPRTLNSKDGAWTKFVSTWYSGNSKTAVLSISNENLEGLGNDFAIDDISFHD